MSYEQLLLGLLLYAVFPLWLIVGLADGLCHQLTDLPHTSGVRESALHVAMLSQLGLGTLIVLFVEISAPVLFMLGGIVVAHTLTTYVDIAYTLGRRRIGALEQMIHGWLQILPFIAWGLLALAHWPQTLALVNGDIATWSLQLRDPPLPAALVVSVIGLSVVFAAAPVFLELLQAWRTGRRLIG